MKSEERLKTKTFATFRVSGDSLTPELITKTLKFYPTLAYRKGEQYSIDERSLKLNGRTGVWFLSTERIVASDKLADHLVYVFFVLGLVSSLSTQRRPIAAEPASVYELNFQFRTVMDLQKLMKQAALKATLTCFWHGFGGTKPPTVPYTNILEMVSIEVETDFDADSEPEEGSTLVA